MEVREIPSSLTTQLASVLLRTKIPAPSLDWTKLLTASRNMSCIFPY